MRRILTCTVVALGALASACSGGGGKHNGGVASLANSRGGKQATTTTTLKPEDAALAFAKCMREHGVDMPDPQFDSGGGGIRQRLNADPNSQTFRDAQKACEKFMPFRGGEGGRGVPPDVQDRMLKMAQCMRRHGIDMPDPQPGSGGFVFRGRDAGGNFDPDDPKFEAAQRECAKEVGLPDRGERRDVQRAPG